MTTDHLSQPSPRLLTISQAERLLGISRSSIYRLIRSGALTPVHINRSVRISVAEIDRFIDSITEKPEGAE